MTYLTSATSMSYISVAPGRLGQDAARNYGSNILAKLQVSDPAQAIVQARDAGLGHQSRTGQDIQPACDPIRPATAGTPAS